MTQVSRDSPTRLGATFRVVGGGTPSTQIAGNWNGEIPWITSADIDEKHQITPRKRITYEAIESSATNLVPKGSVIVVTRVGLGKVAEAPTDLCFSQDCHALLFDHGKIDPRFVVHQLSRSTQIFNYVSRGTTISGVTKKQLLDLDFWLPSLSEQRRIVAKIEEQLTRLEAGVAALKRVQANLKRYRASVLTSACMGKLVPIEAEVARTERHSFESGSQFLQRLPKTRRSQLNGSGNRKGPTALDTTALHALPDGWVWTNVEQIGEVIGGLTKNPKRDSLPRKLPYLRVANVYADELRLDDIEEIGVSEGELERLRLRKDDLLVVEGNGSLEQIGRVARWDGSIDPCVHQNHLIKVRLTGINPRWVLMWMLSSKGRQQIEGVAASTSGLHTLSTGKVARLPVPIPPLAEQLRIVAEVDRRLSVIEELDSQTKTDLARADRLRQSILENAFKERVTASKPVDAVVPIRKQPMEIPRSKRHFARAVLSAEILHQLHAEPTFGRIKHQKIFHLCEHIAQLNEIQGQYYREAAGPLDNKLIYSNEAELKKQSWYKEVPRKEYGHTYRPLTKAGGHEKYLERRWPKDKLATIERLIKLMRRWDTDRCEIFSTTYAAWNDLILSDREVTDDAILHEVLNDWHESKRRFPEERWRKAIAWMRSNGFTPTGYGKPTRKSS